MPTIGTTIDVIRALHGEQTDLAGKPYWLHPVAVMALLPSDASDDLRHAALLHDVLEDVPNMTADFLRGLEYSARIVDIVEGVTRTPEKGTYKEWIASIAASGDLEVIELKIADITHNLSEERRAGITDPEKKKALFEMSHKRWNPALMLLLEARRNLKG
ncbi:hypothetical protein [Microcystis phage Mwe-JY26]